MVEVTSNLTHLETTCDHTTHLWLVVSTHLKNMLVKLDVKIKNLWNHHLDLHFHRGYAPQQSAMADCTPEKLHLFKLHHSLGQCPRFREVHDLKGATFGGFEDSATGRSVRRSRRTTYVTQSVNGVDIPSPETELPQTSCIDDQDTISLACICQVNTK